MGQAFHNHMCHFNGVAGQYLASACSPATKQAQGLFRRLPIPRLQTAQYMACIRRCDTGDLDQTPRHQSLQCLPFKPRLQDRAYRMNRPPDPVQQGKIAFTQSSAFNIRNGTDEPAVMFAWNSTAQLGVQRIMDSIGVIHGDQTDRQQATRPQSHTALQPVRDKMHLAVPPQTEGPHGNRLYHGSVGSDTSTIRINCGSTLAQNGDISGCSTNVGYHRLVGSSQPARANNACRRATQNRFDRPCLGLHGRHQRTIAANNHQGCVDPDLGQHILGSSDQTIGHTDQARVQHCGQRPFGSVQACRQMMRATDRTTRDARDQRSGAVLMVRIACGELCRDRETGYTAHLIQPSLQRGQIQRGNLDSGVAMPA